MAFRLGPRDTQHEVRGLYWFFRATESSVVNSSRDLGKLKLGHAVVVFLALDQSVELSRGERVEMLCGEMKVVNRGAPETKPLFLTR